VKRTYHPHRAASSAERARRFQKNKKVRRQEAADADAFALWAGVAGEITTLSGAPPVPLLQGELIRSGPLGLVRIFEVPPARLTHEQKLAAAALQKHKRPVAGESAGIAQFADLGRRLGEQRAREWAADFEDQFLAKLEPEPKPEAMLEADQPVWPACDEGDARAIIEDDRQAILKARRQEREGAIRKGTARELTLRDGTTETDLIARAASGVRKIAITPALERRYLAMLEREAARPPFLPFTDGKSLPLTNEWVATDKLGPMTRAGWGYAPKRASDVCKCPIPGSVLREDWSKFNPYVDGPREEEVAFEADKRAHTEFWAKAEAEWPRPTRRRGSDSLLPSTTMRWERRDDIALAEKYTLEAVMQQSEDDDPDDKAATLAFLKERAERERDADNAAAAEASAHEGFVDGEPPAPLLDETFEPMKLNTARTLKQDLIKALLEELELVDDARGEHVMSKQEADRFVETMLALELEDTVAFARFFLDLLFAPKKDVAPQLTDRSGAEMEIIKTSKRDYEYAQRTSDAKDN
jgi:hypothetical protein